MFGVLVVRQANDGFAYLSAYSGMLDGSWRQPGFVPPLFDPLRQQGFLAQGESQLKALNQRLEQLQRDPQRIVLQQQIEQAMQDSVQALYQMKARHRQQKAQRRQLRQRLANDEALAQLAYQSQQDKRDYKALKNHWQAIIDGLQLQLESNFEQAIGQLKTRRKTLSRALHLQLFDGYELSNFQGQRQALRSFYPSAEPPGGSGDCAAPKLLQYAAVNRLEPLALAEFWYGAPASGSVRRDGDFYPPCRAKCQPILPFMLRGVTLQQAQRNERPQLRLQPQIIFEDDDLLVLNKPAGLLSIPGKQITHSVQDWLQQRYAEYCEPLLVHRLDMATSGLLLAAKHARAHKNLQRQFIQRSIQKRYVAILSAVLHDDHYQIDLPLRVDLDDRPRQCVCERYGKPAQTRVEVIERAATTSRVYFYPHTGRTHQLRVHAAHHQGLNAPIVGDSLYGAPAKRLYLHAESLQFVHPRSGQQQKFELAADF